MVWYVLRNNIKRGPFSDEQIGKLAQAGRFKPGDLVWKTGLLKWVPITEVPGLLQPPSIPTRIKRNELKIPQTPCHDTPPNTIGNQKSTRARPSEPFQKTIDINKKWINGSYIARHWRGEIALPVSYWVNNFLLTLFLVMFVKAILLSESIVKTPKLAMAICVMLWFLSAAVTLWQLVGTWRSATKYIALGKSKTWGNLARIAIIIGFIRAIVDFISIGVPQVTEFAQIAIGQDPIGKYQLRIIRDASELEISGPIVFGLTDDVELIIETHPTIKTIHLNSNGGRVNEARRLRDLISQKNLKTYTATGCSSACTLAYAAGKDRLISKDASLGFHRYSFPGMKGTDFEKEYEIDKSDWLSRGITIAFIQKAFSTPNIEMWNPTHRELYEANFITGYPEDGEVAISGFNIRDLDKVEEEFLKIPLYAALKNYEPLTYESIISEFKDGLTRGRSTQELREKIFPQSQSILLKRLPYASDAALREFTILILEQMSVLSNTNPDICFDYIFSGDGGLRFSANKYFSKDLQEKELLLSSNIIRSAAEKKNYPPDETQIEKQFTKVLLKLTKRHGDDVFMLAQPDLGKSKKTKMCQMTYDLYQEVLRLPEKESGAILRFMFASTKKDDGNLEKPKDSLKSNKDVVGWQQDQLNKKYMASITKDSCFEKTDTSMGKCPPLEFSGPYRECLDDLKQIFLDCTTYAQGSKKEFCKNFQLKHKKSDYILKDNNGVMHIKRNPAIWFHVEEFCKTY